MIYVIPRDGRQFVEHSRRYREHDFRAVHDECHTRGRTAGTVYVLDGAWAMPWFPALVLRLVADGWHVQRDTGVYVEKFLPELAMESALLRARQMAPAPIHAFGASAQREQSKEECAELITSLCHYTRGKANEWDVVGEIADVLVTALQMADLFGADLVALRMGIKLDALEARIQNQRARPHTETP